MNLHLMQFADLETASLDSVVSRYWMAPDLPPEDPDYLPGTWQGGSVFPDTAVKLNAVPQTGYWMIIASMTPDATLAGHAACQVAWDSENAVVLGGVLEGNDIAVLDVQPVPSGSYQPWPIWPEVTP